MEFNKNAVKEKLYRIFTQEFDPKFLLGFIIYTFAMIVVSVMIFLDILALGSILRMDDYVLAIVSIGGFAWKIWMYASIAYILVILLGALFLFPRPVMQYSYDRIREVSDWMLQGSHIRAVTGERENIITQLKRSIFMERSAVPANDICVVNTPFLLPDGDHIRYSVTRLGKGVFIFSDDGLLKSYLTMAGKTEDEAVKIMEDFADKHGLLPSLEGHIEFCIHEGAEEFTSKYRDFMQAMIVGTELAR